MALIKCPECGKEGVSSNATACPSCGYSISAHFEKINEERKRQDEKIRQEEARASMEAKIKKYNEEKQKEALLIRKKEQEEQKIQIEKDNKKRRLVYIIHAIIFALFSSLCIYGLINNAVICIFGGLIGIFFTIYFFLAIIYREAGIFFMLSGVGIFFTLLGCGGTATFVGQLLFLFGIIIVIFFLYLTLTCIERKKLQRNNPAEYQKLLKSEAEQREKLEKEHIAELKAEREFAERSQKDPSPWSVKYYTFPCVYCGHYKVRPATWDDKRFSVAFWGVHSPKIGKRYKCERCGSIW